MGFWIYMFIISLLIPLTMVGFGRYFMKKAPKEINAVFGYRTPMSMKNKETWEFAHKYMGKIWFMVGLILTIITIFLFLLIIGKNTDYIGGVGAIISGVQIAALIVAIIPTEIALKKKFDKNGIKRY